MRSLLCLLPPKKHSIVAYDLAIVILLIYDFDF